MPHKNPVEVVLRPTDASRVARVIANRYPQAPRRELDRLFAEGAVRINGTRCKKGDHVDATDIITLTRRPRALSELATKPETSLDIAVLCKTRDYIAINKLPGIPCHPLHEDDGGTAANWLAAHAPSTITASEDPRECGLVHRLDNDTSGVLIAAHSRDAWTRLRGDFRDHRVHKTYWVIVDAPIEDGECDLPICQRGDHGVAGAAGDALAAMTSWRVLAKSGGFSLVACSTQTGRRHQVRVHLAAAGAPLVGDTLYGGSTLPGQQGFFLHAASVTLPGQPAIRAPLPDQQQARLSASGLTTPAIVP